MDEEGHGEGGVGTQEISTFLLSKVLLESSLRLCLGQTRKRRGNLPTPNSLDTKSEPRL